MTRSAHTEAGSAAWRKLPDEWVAAPTHRDACPDCGQVVAARTPHELGLLRAAHGAVCEAP